MEGVKTHLGIKMKVERSFVRLTMDKFRKENSISKLNNFRDKFSCCCVLIQILKSPYIPQNYDQSKNIKKYIIPNIPNMPQIQHIPKNPQIPQLPKKQK